MNGNERIIEVSELLVKMKCARSLSEIAKKCGKTSQYYTDLKKGKALYSREFLEILAEKYPIDKNYVLTGKGEKLKTNNNDNLDEVFDNKVGILSEDTRIDLIVRSLDKMTDIYERDSKTNERNSRTNERNSKTIENLIEIIKKWRGERR